MKQKLLKYIREGRTPTVTLWVTVAMFMLASIAMIGVVRSRIEIKEKNEQLKQLNEQYDKKTLENEALKELLTNGTDEYIERRAREDLDMVLPGERVYIVRAGN